MTDPVKAARAIIKEWYDKNLPVEAVLANAIRDAQREGIEEGRRLAAADVWPGVNRDKVLGLLDAAADRGVYGIGNIIAAVRLLVEGEK